MPLSKILASSLSTGVGGKLLSHKITQITENSERASATSYADDLDFGSFTPSSSNSIVLISGVANFDGGTNTYLFYKWVIDGSDFLSTTSTTPVATHVFYNSTSLNNNAYMPSTIFTSITNTDGSAIPVKCQGKVSTGGNNTILRINRSNNNNYSGSPSTVIWLEVAN
tara:strand:- start:177 stop:680 length:504 start_codon:yes stop_codon:yes gene_type:complete